MSDEINNPIDPATPGTDTPVEPMPVGEPMAPAEGETPETV